MMDLGTGSVRTPGRAIAGGRPRRFLAGSAAALVGLAATVAIQVGTAAPASAVPGLVRVQGSGTANGAWQTGFVNCPSGTVTLGGGAQILDGGTHTIMLMGMRATRTDFAASAAAPVGSVMSFGLNVYAICGQPPAGLEYVQKQGVASSSTFKHETVACPPGKRVISAGAAIGGGSAFVGGPASVGLTLLRHDGPMTIGRASAREIAAGYSNFWNVDTSLVCAFALPGQQNAAQVFSGSSATVTCPSGTRVHGVGGGGAIFDTGPQFLQSVYPLSSLTSVVSTMTAAPPAGVGMVASAVCAS